MKHCLIWSNLSSFRQHLRHVSDQILPVFLCSFINAINAHLVRKKHQHSTELPTLWRLSIILWTTHLYSRLDHRTNIENRWKMIEYFLFISLIPGCFLEFYERDGQHLNVYTGDQNWISNHFDHDCLFGDTNNPTSQIITIIPYCFRPELVINSIIDENPCYGELVSFQTLRSMNITASDLNRWNAAIRMIDMYEKYLSGVDQTDGYQLYCNCSSLLHFGEFCQYHFEQMGPVAFPTIFNDFLFLQGSEVRRFTSPEKRREHFTCYVGILCQNHLICLDWRQICNGVVDCDHGEDEPADLCSQLELNECDADTEFRCKNGMCIPLVVSDDSDYDCIDRSDRPALRTSYGNLIQAACIPYDDIFCEELTCRWKEYSCGNSQCLSYADAGSGIDHPKRSCFNQRNKILLERLFRSEKTNICWSAMLCLTGFSHLYANMSCSNRTVESDIHQSCPEEFFFPPNPVIYSFVFFLYEKTNRTDWQSYTGPNLICYDRASCTTLTLMDPIVWKKNLSCFYVNAAKFSWTTFYGDVVRIFAPCFHLFENSLSIANELLYYCTRSRTSISIHRVKDKRNDCFFHEDEDPAIDLCSYLWEDHFRCLKNQSECIRQSLVRDFEPDCSDGSDEYFTATHAHCQGKACQRHFQTTTSLAHFYPFDQLCDQHQDSDIFINNGNETDETDCEHWPYNCLQSPYTRCDRVWHCPNGIDELSCLSNFENPQIHFSFNCSKFEHYCIRFVNDTDGIRISCIPHNRLGDRIIDCIGATDEQTSSICTKNYPFDHRRRFHCMNSSICITPEQVCDTIIDCPNEDDERVCPWLYRKNLTEFHCQNAPSRPLKRCQRDEDDTSICKIMEHLWFCDLGTKSFRFPSSHVPVMTPYPTIGRGTKYISSIDLEPSQISSIERKIVRSSPSPDHVLYCNHGYRVRHAISMEKLHCLCPPAYYGTRCQYQAERLTIMFKIQNIYYLNPQTVFRLVILLLNENHMGISHDEIVSHPLLSDEKRFLVYLVYERMKDAIWNQRIKPKHVRIDSYAINNEKVHYVASWFFTVPFPFLPVNRMSLILTLENESFRIFKCKKQCSAHGKCMYYLNDRRIEYCLCEQGWYGDRCHLKYEFDLCHRNACAPHSQCMVLNYERKLIKCICPLGRSGPQCYIAYNPCSYIQCQHGGTCLPLDQRNFGYVCVCQVGYNGERCEYLRRLLSVAVGAGPLPSNHNHIPAAIVIVAQIKKNAFMQKRFLFTNLLLPATLNAYGGVVQYAFIQFFHNVSSISYYVVAIQQKQNPVQTLNTSVIPSNRCINVSTFFNETVLYQYSYLRRLKLYHLPCNMNKGLRCFFDEYRMCVCTSTHHSACYVFNHEHHNCDFCKNEGLCVQEDAREPHWQYICICRPCSFGTLCQFSTTNFFINLDILIGVEIKTGNPSLYDQPLVITITLILLVLIFMLGCVSNMISFGILYKKEVQKMGCDFYLLHLTIVSQIGLVVLLARFLHMLLIQLYVFDNALILQLSCLFLEYFARLIPPLFDWFTVFISMERTYTVMRHIHITRLVMAKRLKMSRWIVVAIYLFNIITTLHRPFHLTLVGEPVRHRDHPLHPWCILHFDSIRWNAYEKFINIFHLLAPLLSNVSSIAIFLFYKTKFQSKTTIGNTGKSICTILKEQILKYKPILISTVIVILCNVPRAVLALVYACVEQRWHRYIYLAVYLISFLPLTQILLIYILPSPKYRTRLVTILRRYCRWQLQNTTHGTSH